MVFLLFRAGRYGLLPSVIDEGLGLREGRARGAGDRAAALRRMDFLLRSKLMAEVRGRGGGGGALVWEEGPAGSGRVLLMNDKLPTMHEGKSFAGACFLGREGPPEGSELPS